MPAPLLSGHGARRWAAPRPPAVGLHARPPDRLPVEVGVVLQPLPPAAIPVVVVPVALLLLLPVLLLLLLLLLLELLLLPPLLVLAGHDLVEAQPLVPRAVVCEEALGGDADDALADDEEEVHGRHVGPLVGLGGAHARQGLAGEELEVPLGLAVAPGPLRDVAPERGRELPDLGVRGRRGAVHAAGEQAADPLAPGLRPGGGPRALLVVPLRAALLAALPDLRLVRRPDLDPEPLPEVPPEAHLRELHHDCLPVPPHAVVLPLRLRERGAVQRAEELRAVALGRAVVGRAQRHPGVEVQEPRLVVPLREQHLRLAVVVRGGRGEGGHRARERGPGHLSLAGQGKHGVE
mmetsp:Transcript_43771/g.135216  ORF Transcript_43771/g.135216 Transcript_43771/m.135216 type:complete len:349 (+) Transcript_43771:1491-2537(+)